MRWQASSREPAGRRDPVWGLVGLVRRFSGLVGSPGSPGGGGRRSVTPPSRPPVPRWARVEFPHVVPSVPLMESEVRPPPQSPQLGPGLVWEGRGSTAGSDPPPSVLSAASPYNRCKGSIYLVFDFCEHDLAGLLSNTHVKFTLSEIKKVMQMLLNGLYYIHRNKILHRDMKAANVLITRDGVLKLADFGLARAFSLAKNSQPNHYTNRVVTLWYRPPELLLGERDYGPPIDLWGGGCIMAEMWTRSPIMQGNTEQHQLTLISQLCGSITPEVWPNVDKYELYQKLDLPRGQKRKVKERLKAYVKDPYALDLIDKLLVLDPAQRIDSDDALNHDFFWSDPMPSDLKNMLSTHSTSMFEYLAPPRRRGGHMPQQPANQSRNPAATNQTEFDRVF
uniref:Cyclin dependent kinase 9 n=1 Tax=Ornithorhynchus anatinus TaxID=9258 RepID=A0A6I8NIP6_ORNAN